MSARRPVPAPTKHGGSSVVDAIGEVAVPNVVKLLSQTEAERMTREIKLTASGIRNNLFKLRNQIDVAKASNVWNMMGFPSWTAYLSDTLAEEPMRVSREERLELVGYLAGEGMSARAIAPIVGVSKSQVANDIVEVSTSGRQHELAGLPNPAPMFDAPTDSDAPQPSDPEMAAPAAPLGGAAIAGMDGKTYQRPQPPAPRRTSIVDDARNAGYQLRKTIERLDRIRNDDRFDGHASEILAAMQPHLGYARDVLNDYGVEGFLTTEEQR